jgi:L-alanine-DL-glutamate epimerase-like enolase superfamily enzyme
MKITDITLSLLGCCIENTDFYEYFGSLREEGRRWGMVNAPLVEEGHLRPPDGPGWGAEWDEEQVRHLTVQEI